MHCRECLLGTLRSGALSSTCSRLTAAAGAVAVVGGERGHFTKVVDLAACMGASREQGVAWQHLHFYVPHLHAPHACLKRQQPHERHHPTTSAAASAATAAAEAGTTSGPSAAIDAAGAAGTAAVCCVRWLEALAQVDEATTLCIYDATSSSPLPDLCQEAAVGAELLGVAFRVPTCTE